jgi:integrase
MPSFTQYMTLNEIHTVLEDLRLRSIWSVSSAVNRIIVRLSLGAGLRCMEIVGLNVGDLVLGGSCPVINVRGETAKGGKPRKVPLFWDRQTLADLANWQRHRTEVMGATRGDPFVCGVCQTNRGGRLIRSMAAKRWKTAIKCLGTDRVSQLSIHCGRHSFASHAVRAGRTPAELRDALGHANITTTETYLHSIPTECGDLF